MLSFQNGQMPKVADGIDTFCSVYENVDNNFDSNDNVDYSIN